jgi:uncharacterized protein YkwD
MSNATLSSTLCCGFLLFNFSSTTPALAQDLNAFRAQHKRPPLTISATLAGLAYQQASLMAGRSQIDHKDFRKRMGPIGSTHAENVAVIACARPDAKPVPTFAGRRACDCDDEACAISIWAKSGGHRRNMLRGDVSAYGIASVTGSNGRKYWALELGGE